MGAGHVGMSWNWRDSGMDSVDYDPNVLDREQRMREQMTTREQPLMPPPEMEALQQMLNDAINREIVLRAEIVRLRRIMSGG